MTMQPHGEIPEFRARYRYLVAVVLLTFLVLFGRLWQLQVIRGDRYGHITENNFVQERRIPTVRGLIHDRSRRLLVANRPSYDVSITPRFATDTSIERLIRELALEPEQARALRGRISEVRGKSRYYPRPVLRDISRDQLARLETNRNELHGINVLAQAHRQYLQGNLMAHVLGFMNEINLEELRRDRDNVYVPGDLTGRYGIERMYESHLRGVPGIERIIVDAHGLRKEGAMALGLLASDGRKRRVEPMPGHNLILTINLDLQRLVERALRNHPSGAAVVLEVSSGRVLAAASKPAFDPNLLTGGMDPGEMRRLSADPHRPLLDKVFRENYYPGSTYKLIPAIAALEEGLITGEETITCKGWHHFGRRNFRCSHAHGKTNLREAIVGSCNVYFYTLAEQVGMDAMAKYARLLGLGASTGLGLNGEVSGFLPTKEWYRQRKRPFRIGFTLNSAIGQGNTKVTPIQLANLYAAVANGGRLLLPQIVERIETRDGMVVQSFEPRLRRELPFKPRTMALIRDALAGVVADPDGTAYDARLSDIAVAGKTGTAQVGRRAKKGQPAPLADHAWFAAYAPVERPLIAVVVLIEHGGRAAKVAAPVAMEIVSGFFKHVTSGVGRAAGSPTSQRATTANDARGDRR